MALVYEILFFPEALVNASSQLSFWSSPWDMFMVEFDKQQWTFFVYFYYLLQNTCLSKVLSEKEEGQEKKRNLFPVISTPWRGLEGQPVSSWPLTLLCSLILGQGGKILIAGHR